MSSKGRPRGFIMLLKHRFASIARFHCCVLDVESCERLTSNMITTDHEGVLILYPATLITLYGKRGA